MLLQRQPQALRHQPEHPPQELSEAVEADAVQVVGVVQRHLQLLPDRLPGCPTASRI